MSGPWIEGPTDDEGSHIVRMEASPYADDAGSYSTEGRLKWRGFKAWLRSFIQRGMQFTQECLTEGTALGRRYLRGKAASEGSQALKAVAEACEATAKTELAAAQAGRTREETVALRIKNLRDIQDLPLEAQVLAMAEMFREDPGLPDQIQRVAYLYQSLHLKHGFEIAVGPADADPESTEDRTAGVVDREDEEPSGR